MYSVQCIKRYMAPEKVFLEVARKLLEFTMAEAGSHLAIGATQRELVCGAIPQRGPGAAPWWGSRGRDPWVFRLCCLFLSMDCNSD